MFVGNQRVQGLMVLGGGHDLLEKKVLGVFQLSVPICHRLKNLA
jgi:hypothetical protein